MLLIISTVKYNCHRTGTTSSCFTTPQSFMPPFVQYRFSLDDDDGAQTVIYKNCRQINTRTNSAAVLIDLPSPPQPLGLIVGHHLISHLHIAFRRKPDPRISIAIAAATLREDNVEG